jgi:hypothetical protein
MKWILVAVFLYSPGVTVTLTSSPLDSELLCESTAQLWALQLEPYEILEITCREQGK